MKKPTSKKVIAIQKVYQNKEENFKLYHYKPEYNIYSDKSINDENDEITDYNLKMIKMLTIHESRRM